MVYKIEFHPKAEKEFDDALLRYHDIEKELALRLFEDYLAIEAQLETNPNLYAQVYDEKRRAILRSFPYSIIFVIKGDTVYILSFFHQKRNPKVWQERT